MSVLQNRAHMKRIGLIGGISWVSTVDYYRYINLGINARLGANNFAECMIYSFNYQELITKNNSCDTEGTFRLLLDAAMHLKNSQVTALVLCANTMHMYAERLEQVIGLPVIHVATATAITIRHSGLKKVGLLGTKFTMERDFFKDKLTARGIQAIIPDDADKDFVHQTIFEELGKGLFLASTRQRYIAIIEDLKSRGAEGIILGCTEIPLLIKQSDVTIPVFDTTLIHSETAVSFMLGESGSL